METNMQPKIFILVFLLVCISCLKLKSETELKVLQFNIWQEGTVVEDGLNGIADNIAALEPDLVTFSEVRNYNDKDFISKIIGVLNLKGHTYYGKTSVSTGILSKYPIKKQEVIYPLKNDRGSVIKAEIMIKDKTVFLYSAHLDYTHYACYLPRGYDGVTWEKSDSIITNPAKIAKMNQNSLRIEAIHEIIKDSKNHSDKEAIRIIGGDFNEPSHLDWIESTKNKFDHNGVVYAWDCSVLLFENGFKDAFREVYPNPISHPGFTFPSDNERIDISKLTWAPDADERDRIDFIYFRPYKNLDLKNIIIVGPSKSIVRSERKEENSDDKFIPSHGVWPTDHKAVMATFILK